MIEQQTPPAQALAPQNAPAPIVIAEKPGFRAGLGAVFSGYGYLARTPDVWLLAAVPMIVALVCTIVFGAFAVGLAPKLVSLFMAKPASAASGALGVALYVALQVLVTLAALVVAVALAFALGKPLSGPALEKIVRRVEADLGCPAWPAPTLLEDVLRSISSTLVAAAFTVPILVVLGLVGFFFPLAAVVVFPLQFAVTAMAAAWDFCDYPLSIRGVPVALRLRFVERNVGSVMGFGAGLALLSFLPCTLLVVLPAGIIGATHLVASLQRWEQSGRAERR